MILHWSLGDSKSPQVSRTRFRILAVLSNAVVWIVSTRPPISKSSRPFNNPLVTVPNAPITIGTITTFIIIIIIIIIIINILYTAEQRVFGVSSVTSVIRSTSTKSYQHHYYISKTSLCFPTLSYFLGTNVLTFNIYNPGSHRGLMSKVLNCCHEVSKFEVQLGYYVHFRTYTIRKVLCFSTRIVLALRLICYQT